MVRLLSFPVFRSGSGYRNVDLRVQVTAPTRNSLMAELVQAIAENNVPPERCIGLVGWASNDQLFSGVRWRYEPMLKHSLLAVIYHPDAIVPPAFVLDRIGIVYGMVSDSIVS